MANINDSSHNNVVPHQISDESNSEEELIDLDKVLPLKKESNWLLESNNHSSDFYGSFNELQFSNPLISNFIKTIYLNGKSKQVLHHLMYLNDRMTISCDNYSHLYNNNISTLYRGRSNKRHSLAVINSNVMEDSFNNDSDSLTDSLNSIESIKNMDIKNGNQSTHINVICDRMTQSSITDYNTKFFGPQESDSLPRTKNILSQNILSRTYDKEDLEILKQTETLSVSPQVDGSSNVDHQSKLESSSISNSTDTKPLALCREKSIKRVFPTTHSEQLPSDPNLRPRPSSVLCQVDKLSKRTIDRCIKISQQKKLNINPKLLLKTNENIFETDVLTPVNSQRNAKNMVTRESSRLKPPVIRNIK